MKEEFTVGRLTFFVVNDHRIYAFVEQQGLNVLWRGCHGHGGYTRQQILEPFPE